MGVTSPNITNRRSTSVHRLNGTTHWTVTEFDDGHDYMVTIECAGGVRMQAHFTGEQWSSLVGFLYAFPLSGEAA